MKKHYLVMALFAAMVSACGGGGGGSSDGPTPAPTASPTTSPEPTASPTPTEVLSDHEKVAAIMAHILRVSTNMPTEGEVGAKGSGGLASFAQSKDIELCESGGQVIFNATDQSVEMTFDACVSAAGQSASGLVTMTSKCSQKTVDDCLASDVVYGQAGNGWTVTDQLGETVFLGKLVFDSRQEEHVVKNQVGYTRTEGNNEFEVVNALRIFATPTTPGKGSVYVEGNSVFTSNTGMCPDGKAVFTNVTPWEYRQQSSGFVKYVAGKTVIRYNSKDWTVRPDGGGVLRIAEGNFPGAGGQYMPISAARYGACSFFQ